MTDAVTCGCLSELAAMSCRYGADADYVLAGGGNTSYKNDGFLYVKGSGTALATIRPEDFVVLRRDRLAAIWDKSYPALDEAREAGVLADMMAARADGESRRPSVEALLHGLFPYKFVLHVHPALVNGMTCGREGESVCHKLFPESVWIPEVKPGYTLATACLAACDEYGKTHSGLFPRLMFLQNHGVFFAADTIGEIDDAVSAVMSTLKTVVTSEPDFGCDGDYDEARAVAFAVKLRYAFGLCAVFSRENALLEFDPLTKPLTPDHIVYTRTWPLVIKCGSGISEQYEAYIAEHGCAPRIVVVPKLGVFACGKTPKEADTALALWRDEARAAYYARFFGGVKPMSDGMIEFITRWEVESYRSGLNTSGTAPKRFDGRIAVVTGGAQGFGRGIAEALAADGAYVAVADMNFDGAKSAACDISKTSPAFAVEVNVTDEKSVEQMINAVALRWGGVDIFINNAGIVRAGGLDEMTRAQFELVTSVNYTAYFLCAKYVSGLMKLAHTFAPDRFFDIIEINSKSGLSGSNKNFAYAGSKFGGIGLTQSFALELSPYNIKVNAVCPGNFLEGPLWTDPEKGLLVQYLKAGKVPGAKTTADVLKFYESKVPLGRGCRIADVTRAIAYLVEQQYETGQALPVTGGQEMLK